jgi:hypothetical protein
MSNPTTRMAENLMGGPLSQQGLLTAMRGASISSPVSQSFTVNEASSTRGLEGTIREAARSGVMEGIEEVFSEIR